MTGQGGSWPVPPIAFSVSPEKVTPHIATVRVVPSEATLTRIGNICPTSVAPVELTEASRDWWPLAMIWATEGQSPGLAAIVASPQTVEQCSQLAAVCNDERIPLTVAGGRSGVCGASVPLFGGLLLDVTAMRGITAVDDTSMVVDVRSGTFGNDFEAQLGNEHDLTVGHWPQSIDLATVGGWVACRGAGQFSTRYGKIEDIVSGLTVVLADGTVIQTGDQPRQAVGADLNQIFIGSEGTLGIITDVRLRAHPKPVHFRKAAYGFDSFEAGLEVMRKVLRRGATPAVIRLYDSIESQRNHATSGTHDLLIYDEGDPDLVDATVAVIEGECAEAHAQQLDPGLVDNWLTKRNDVAALEALISRGFVVDTMEVTGSWAKLADIYRAGIDAIGSIEETIAVSAHQSHSYTNGGCIYFTFAANPAPEERERYYREAWDKGTTAVMREGASLSHHHGVGLNRARFVADALGPAAKVFQGLKSSLDPNGILNPGKLGLAHPFGEINWP